MDLQKKLFMRLMEIANMERDEDYKTPSIALDDSMLLACEEKDIPAGIHKPSESAAWGITYNQGDDEYFSVRIARKDDCAISMLIDFYSRGFEINAEATDSTEHDGVKVIDRINSRHKEDLDLVCALSAGQAIYLLIPTNEGLEYYQLTNAEALSRFIWNNLVRHYTNRGIGYQDEPASNEEQMATTIIGQGSESSIILAFDSSEFILQIDAGTGIFLHGHEESIVRSALEKIPENIEFELA